jgi:hypothetical protein
VDDSPYILDGADASLRKTVSLLNKIEGKTVSAPTLDLSVLSDISGVSRGVVENRSGILTGGLGHVKIFRANRKRTYLFIQNTSLKVGMIVGIGRTPETATSIFLPPNGGGVVYDGSFIPTEDVWITNGGGTLGSGLVYIAMQAPPDPDPIIVGSGFYYPYDIGFGEDLLGGGITDPSSALVAWFRAGVGYTSGFGATSKTPVSGDLGRISTWSNSVGASAYAIDPFNSYSTLPVTVFGENGSPEVDHNGTTYVLTVNGVYDFAYSNGGSPVYVKGNPSGGYLKMFRHEGRWRIWFFVAASTYANWTDLSLTPASQTYVSDQPYDNVARPWDVAEWDAFYGNSPLKVFHTGDFGPFMEWEPVNLSGSPVTQVNGDYVKTSGFLNGRPVYKNNNLQIHWAGTLWAVHEPGYGAHYGFFEESGSPYTGNEFWTAVCRRINNPATDTLTVTKKPTALRFDGSEYLSFANPLTGNSAELFAVIQPDALGIGETSGPVIGNIGGPNLETFLGADGVVGFAPQLFRGESNGPMHTYGTTPQHSSWHLFSISSGPDLYVSRRNTITTLNFYPVWSRNTFNNEGPFIGRSTQGEGAYFKGRIAEILLYNRALTSQERELVRAYLNEKYSLY